MGRVIPDAQGKSLVIWVVGILLTHGGINVVWIPVRPRIDGLAACSTFESETLRHGFLLLYIVNEPRAPVALVLPRAA